MPRRHGQAKISEGENLRNISRKAYSGTFTDEPGHEFLMRVWLATGMASQLPNADAAELFDEIASTVGHRVLDAMIREDVKFFEQLATTMDAFRVVDAIKSGKPHELQRDPILYGMLRLHKESPGQVWTVGEIVDRLRAFGIRSTRDDVRRRAKLIGMKVDQRPGRRPTRKG